MDGEAQYLIERDEQQHHPYPKKAGSARSDWRSSPGTGGRQAASTEQPSAAADVVLCRGSGAGDVDFGTGVIEWSYPASNDRGGGAPPERERSMRGDDEGRAVQRLAVRQEALREAVRG